MKLKPLLTISAFVAAAAGFYALLYFTNGAGLNGTSGEIKKGMKLGIVHEIKVGDSQVQIGSRDRSKMEPTVKFSRENNVSLGISFPVDNKINPQAENNKITWDSKDKEVYFKNSTSIVPTFEFDILLKQKPQSSTFTYNLDTNNLEFVKNDKDNTYSAYKKGYLNEKGIYNKGELYRIQRPKITDSKGRETWGNLNIDQQKGTLEVAVADSWLASASYPVTVDPTITLNNTNHVVITKIDRFRWKVAVEYEIRDDTGKLLGSDVVIMEAKDGETADQFLGFFKDYLTRRDAVWLLAQGNYTLYEMSNDRLTSSYFQAKDSSDNVKDEYTAQRQARKTILDSLKPEDYPVYSLTLDQAEQLQIPNNPTFTITNERPGAGTEILRPNGVGYNSGLYPQGDTPGWKCIDEASPDDDTTYLWSTSGTSTDGYALGNTALTTETVDSIDVNYRGYKTNFIGSNIYFWAGIRRGGSNTNGTPRNSTSYTSYVETAITRPGGGSWAVGDLDGLEVVVYGEFSTDGWDDETVHVTQAYVTVNYTAPPPTPTPSPTPTPTPTPMTQIKPGVKFNPGVKINMP